MPDPPTMVNAGQLIYPGQAFLSQGWVFILAGLLLGVAWALLGWAMRTVRRSLARRQPLDPATPFPQMRGD